MCDELAAGFNISVHSFRPYHYLHVLFKKVNMVSVTYYVHLRLLRTMYPWLPAPCKQDECFQEAQPQTRFCSCACSLRSSCALSFWDVLFPAQVGFFRDENGKKCARADLCAWVCKKGEQGPCGACCVLVGLILALLQPLKEGRL